MSRPKTRTRYRLVRLALRPGGDPAQYDCYVEIPLLTSFRWDEIADAARTLPHPEMLRACVQRGTTERGWETVERHTGDDLPEVTP